MKLAIEGTGRARWLCLIAIFGVGLILHFWGLSRFNGLIFDEVFFPKYAQGYLSGTPFFDAHPPFGKYLIALGMRIAEIIGPLGTPLNGMADGVPHAAWAYRWVDALAGSILPLVFAGIAWQLTRRWKLVLLTALLTSLDGLFLVESRYGLINIFMVLFGLLGHYFYLAFLNAQGEARSRAARGLRLAAAGLSFGACISVKWSGLAFIAIPWGLWMLAHAQAWNLARRATAASAAAPPHHPLQLAAGVGFPAMLLALIVLPVTFYVVQIQPHLAINKIGFMDLNRQMLAYHRGVKDGPSEHPYCSRWSSWPLMERPISYLFTMRPPEDLTPTAPIEGTTIASTKVHAVHAMGNPVLWWLVVPSVLLVCATATRALLRSGIGIAQTGARRGRTRLQPRPRIRQALDGDAWTALYLAAGYVVSLLPWIGITRCTFIYHYMPSLSFGLLACAFGIERMSACRGGWRLLGIGMVVLVLAAFVYWLPLYLGLPLSMDEWHSRMWFQSWV